MKIAAPLRLALLSVWMAIPVGCAAVIPVLPSVIAAVTDGIMVIDTIARFVDAYLIKHPGKVDETLIKGAIEKTRATLNVALRTAQAAEMLDQAQVDAAFTDFKIAYLQLLALTAPLGVQTGDKLMARPNTINVPEPMALRLRVK
jgi:hypothetical protein